MRALATPTRANTARELRTALGVEGRLERRFGLMTGGREERLVVVERKEIENQIIDGGMRGAQKRFSAAGALLELQPDHGWC